MLIIWDNPLCPQMVANELFLRLISKVQISLHQAAASFGESSQQPNQKHPSLHPTPYILL